MMRRKYTESIGRSCVLLKKNGDMRFWDIQSFNLALLAKQARWLIHSTHSLFYRVYKARYFPNCSFMDAVLGKNPSYVWHSLLAARGIIREGSIWKRVGHLKDTVWPLLTKR